MDFLWFVPIIMIEIGFFLLKIQGLSMFFIKTKEPGFVILEKEIKNSGKTIMNLIVKELRLIDKLVSKPEIIHPIHMQHMQDHPH